MGNILPIDGEKKQQIEEIAKDFMSTFCTEFVLAYGVEFAKMKLKQVDKESYGKKKGKKELMYRKKKELTDPHKVGFLTKKGAIVKNWKKRYFVVNPDYSINYYESEEAHDKGSKPKGVILLAGYKVEEDIENAQIERLKALLKTLGCDENDLPSTKKYSEHTLELMHKRRRAYYITAADEDEKKEWLEMFRTCCQKASGFTNKDPLAQAAFKTAYYRACQKSGWFTRYGDCGGTEEQILSETIVEIVNDRIMSSVYSELAGNFMIRKKLQKQATKVLDSLVLAMVTPSYKALVETTQSLRVPLEKTVDEKKGEIVEVQKKITKELSDKLEKLLNKIVQEATVDMKKMFDELKEVAGRASQEMKKECVLRLLERLISETSESNDVEGLMTQHFKKFDKVALSVWAWDHWYKVWNIEKECLGIVTKYKDTFDQHGQYSSAYKSHDMLTKVADAAFYTFEEYLQERTKESEILKDSKKAKEFMESVKNEIISKYDADLKATPDDISFKQTSKVVLEYVTRKLDPLTKDIRKAAGEVIPEPLEKIVSIDDRYELYVKECVKELVRKAAGIASVEEESKQDEEKEEEKVEEKEIKVEGEKEENSRTEEEKENSEGKEAGNEGTEAENEGEQAEEDEEKKVEESEGEKRKETEEKAEEPEGEKVEETEGKTEEKVEQEDKMGNSEGTEGKTEEKREESEMEKAEDMMGNSEGTDEGKDEGKERKTEEEREESEMEKAEEENKEKIEEGKQEEKVEETSAEKEKTGETEKKENSEKAKNESEEDTNNTTPM